MRLLVLDLPPVPLALLALAFGSACVDTDTVDSDVRVPCDGTTDWDPNRPLVLDWAGQAGVAVDTTEFRDGIELRNASGVALDWFARDQDGGLVALCPKGGLAPGATFTWTVDAFADDVSTNQASVPPFGPDGTWTFRTANTGSWPQLRTFADCELSSDQRAAARAEACPEDTGDTGTDSGVGP